MTLDLSEEARRIARLNAYGTETLDEDYAVGKFKKILAALQAVREEALAEGRIAAFNESANIAQSYALGEEGYGWGRAARRIADDIHARISALREGKE